MAIVRARFLVILLIVGCSPAEPAPPASADGSVDAVSGDATDAPADETSDDDASDGGETADRCCPISPMGCCMDLGGTRTGSVCPRICDMIPTDFEIRTDDAGCRYWYDPPGGGTACNPGGPPDTGAPDVADTGD